MTTGNVLYLLLSVGTFVLFAVVLAYYSWQQSRLGPDIVSASSQPVSHHEPDFGVVA